MTTHVDLSWHCLQCPAAGTGPTSERDAKKHTDTAGHAAMTRGKPA